jgi:hypothetical protein
MSDYNEIRGMEIVLAPRGSALALKQTGEVMELLSARSPAVRFSVDMAGGGRDGVSRFVLKARQAEALTHDTTSARNNAHEGELDRADTLLTGKRARREIYPTEWGDALSCTLITFGGGWKPPWANIGSSIPGNAFRSAG